VKGGPLARRVGLLLAVTLVVVAVGLAVVHPVVGRGTLPSWCWPTICIVGLTLIWLSPAWSLVVKPVRPERRYGRVRQHVAPQVRSTDDARGWFEDPFRTHRYRWFSMGRPTGLVRDGVTESQDPPPDLPYAGSLVPARGTAGADGNGADLQRAGDGQKADYWDAAVDASTWFPIT
jgi:hypothetical protein